MAQSNVQIENLIYVENSEATAAAKISKTFFYKAFLKPFIIDIILFLNTGFFIILMLMILIL